MEDPITQVMFLLIEAARMRSLEDAEAGASTESIVAHTARAQLAHNLTEDLIDIITEGGSSEDD